MLTKIGKRYRGKSKGKRAERGQRELKVKVTAESRGMEGIKRDERMRS